MSSPCDTCTLYPCVDEKEIPKVKRYCPFYHPEPKPMTNADRIRAMSDEELAEFIVKIKYPYRGDGKDYEIALNWLKSPVEVEA